MQAAHTDYFDFRSIIFENTSLNLINNSITPGSCHVPPLFLSK